MKRSANVTSIDAVEMVGTVVELGKGRYADFIGRIFNDPRVNTVVGEGRSYLRYAIMSHH